MSDMVSACWWMLSPLVDDVSLRMPGKLPDDDMGTLALLPDGVRVPADGVPEWKNVWLPRNVGERGPPSPPRYIWFTTLAAPEVNCSDMGLPPRRTDVFRVSPIGIEGAVSGFA